MQSCCGYPGRSLAPQDGLKTRSGTDYRDELAHLFTDKQGFGWLSEDDFVNHFAADVDPVKAKVMHAVQQALATSAFGDVMGIPASKARPAHRLTA